MTDTGRPFDRLRVTVGFGESEVANAIYCLCKTAFLNEKIHSSKLGGFFSFKAAIKCA
jgi:hypothetical protein